MASISHQGPSGGTGGNFFDDFNDVIGGEGGAGFRASILQLQVNAGDTLDHLRVTYRAPGLPTDLGPVQHGDSNGGEVHPTFDIDLSSGERLQRIDGWIANFDGTFEVRGLNFITNIRESGVLGATTNNSFTFEAPLGGEIVALLGRQGLFLDALGVYFRMA